jgi:hypothetical protein
MDDDKLIIFKGGARIGSTNATWPLAKLCVKVNELKITNGWHTCIFNPEDIVSLTFYEFFSPGIKITHIKANYPSKVIFWTLKAEKILEDIKTIGFIPKAEPVAVINNPVLKYNYSIKDSFSFKTLPSSILLLLVSILYFLDFKNFISSSHPRLYAFTASLILLLSSISIIYFKPIQKLFLRSESSLAGVKPVLNLVIVLSTLMLIGLLPSLF